MRPLRVILGLLVWLGLGATLYWSVTNNVMSQGRTITGDLVPALFRHGFSSQERVGLRLETDMWVSRGDPIFIIHADDSFTQIGELESAIDPDGKPITGEMARYAIRSRSGIAKFYPTAPAIEPGATMTFYETPFSTEWIINTLLPAEKRKEVIADVRDTFAAHSEEILEALRPIVEDSLRDALAEIDAALPGVVAKHKEKLQELGGKYQAEIIEKKLLPLVKEEIFPIASAHAKPVANTIGQKLWDKVSVWRFGVRFIWDKTPFADGESVKREFERFLKNDAVPVIEAHTADIVKALQDTVAEASKNKKVQAVFRESIAMVAEDKEVQKVVWQILREAAVENPKVHAALDKHWRGPRAKAAFALAGDRLEAMIIRVGDKLMGTGEIGISPQLARVLRYRLLHKDARFFVLENTAKPQASTGGAGMRVIEVKMGGEPRVHPFVVEKKTE